MSQGLKSRKVCRQELKASSTFAAFLCISAVFTFRRYPSLAHEATEELEDGHRMVLRELLV